MNASQPSALIDPSDILTILEGNARAARANMADAKVFAAEAAGASRLAVPVPGGANGTMHPSPHDRLISQANHANMACNAHLSRLAGACQMYLQWIQMAQAANAEGHPPAGRISPS